jgi:hypothetical protein
MQVHGFNREILDRKKEIRDLGKQQNKESEDTNGQPAIGPEVSLHQDLHSGLPSNFKASPEEVSQLLFFCYFHV